MRGRQAVYSTGSSEAMATWKLGDRLTGDREVWRRATRPDALYLSTAVSLNSEQLKPVFDWFRKTLHIVNHWSPVFSLNLLREGGKSGIVRFLREADLAISDLRVVEKEFRPDMLPDEIPSKMRGHITSQFAGGKISELWLNHDTGRDNAHELNFDDESDGTQKIFALAGPWLDTLRNGACAGG